MTNEFIEVNDLDSCIEKKKALIEEIKELSTKENVAPYELINIQKSYRKIKNYNESAYEEELDDEFYGLVEGINAKLKEAFGSNQEVKESLIKKAEELVSATNFNKATDELNKLFDEWKQTPSCGKELDDELWEKFNAARQAFFDAKHNYFESLKEKFANAKVVKEEIIAKAQELKDAEDILKTNDEFTKLMDEWKAAGHAGKEFEEDLWKEFNEIRQEFYDRRKVYFDELHAKYEEAYTKKQALVEEVKAILEENDFSRETTEKVKGLTDKWKTIGTCGKSKEDKIWKEFRKHMDLYFDGLRANRDERHANWVAHMEEIKARKQDLIEREKRTINRLQNSMGEILGESALVEAKEEVVRREEFIKQLETEIEDIVKQLEK